MTPEKFFTFDRRKNPAAIKAEQSRYPTTPGGAQLVTVRGRPMLLSTDGHALAVVAATVAEGAAPRAGERAPIIPEAVLKAARDGARARKHEQATVALKGGEEIAEARGKEGETMARTREASAIDIDSVLPDRHPIVARIALNAEYLAALQKGLAGTSVELVIRGKVDRQGQLVVDDTLPVEVLPQGCEVADGSFGLVMPVSG